MTQKIEKEIYKLVMIALNLIFCSKTKSAPHSALQMQ